MSKYSLKIYFENGDSETITKGSLEEVDNFIIEKNINNVFDLFEYSTSRISKRVVGNVIFKIEYKHKDQIKEKSIIYKDTLKSFRKNDYLSQNLYELLLKDNNFNKQFFAKYFKDFFIIFKCFLNV